MSKSEPSMSESSPLPLNRPRKLSRVQSLAPPPLKVRKISEQIQNVSILALGPLPCCNSKTGADRDGDDISYLHTNFNTNHNLRAGNMDNGNKQDHDHDYLAYLLQALACLIWTSSYIYTNEHNCNVFEIIIAKGVVGTVLNYLVIQYKQIKTHFEPTHTFVWLLVINGCILAYFYILPLSQMYLPLPVVHTIGCSSIALVYIIDYAINGTRISRSGFSGIILALIGVFLMANNRLIMSFWDDQYVFDSDFGNYHQSSIMLSSLIALLLFLARVLNTYGLVKLKQFPQISVFELNYHGSIVSVFSAGLGYMFRGNNVSMQVFWPSLITIGLGQFVCMSFFFYSLKLTKKIGNVMIINALNIIFAFMFSYFRYHEDINQILIAGATCLLASMAIVIMETQKLRRAGQKQIEIQINNQLQVKRKRSIG